ncbi:hypothetical protein DFH28DRAFT_1087302 [Melampsora americana]|nr:hypothetical protein DFH28DRAFT_1087302 [Melampsora americana]
MSSSLQCRGCGKCFVQLKTAECDQCQWMEDNPTLGVCTIPQCSGCGRCYRYLPAGSRCESCEDINNSSSIQPSQMPAAPAPNLSRLLVPNVSRPSASNFSPLVAPAPLLTASTLPEHAFRGGLLGQESQNQHSNLVPSSLFLNSNVHGTIRASQSGRRTVGQSKGRKKKAINEEFDEDSPYFEVGMEFWYLSGIGKSNTVHGLTTKSFSFNLNSPDWFYELALEVYSYYQKEASESSFPSKANLKNGKKKFLNFTRYDGIKTPRSAKNEAG